MNTTLTLMDLAGAVALLIWGVHMVQTGITRAYGPQLRRTLGYALGNRFKAFLTGLTGKNGSYAAVSAPKSTEPACQFTKIW